MPVLDPIVQAEMQRRIDETNAILGRMKLNPPEDDRVDRLDHRINERIDDLRRHVDNRFIDLANEKHRNRAEWRGFLLGVIVTLLVVALIALTQVHVKP